MADPILHIKDSYYFEVPKLLFPYENRKATQFPAVWISLDPEFQEWEADRLYAKLAGTNAGLPPKENVLRDWHHWVHADHANVGKPLKVFLEEKYQAHFARFKAWKAAEINAANARKDGSIEKVKRYDFGDYVAHVKTTGTQDEAYLEFLNWRSKSQNQAAFESAKTEAGGKEAIEQIWKKEVREGRLPDWSKQKIDGYNAHLSGKILIPQPFATLRNLYEKEGQWYEGLAISKYLVIEIVVGLILVLLFSRFAAKIENGRPAKGLFWNLIEVFLVFIRDKIARPVLGAHDHSHAAAEEHGQDKHSHAEHAHAAPAHAAPAHAKHHASADPASKFLPLLWTVFFFVLGCNLMGMVPWAGAPTASFSVTLALAAVTLATVIVFGMIQFGVLGFLLNQVPGMDLPWYMAILIKPMILLIELLGLLIKHGVLAVRLLANMAAGHLVILGLMGAVFGIEAGLRFISGESPMWQWWVGAPVVVIASAAFSILELFVAFLQAYVFTFLSALFIGAAIHKH